MKFCRERPFRRLKNFHRNPEIWSFHPFPLRFIPEHAPRPAPPDYGGVLQPPAYLVQEFNLCSLVTEWIAISNSFIKLFRHEFVKRVFCS
ncbi:hypothetical protein EVAR_35999_1 [Eumeta japonica]|uniref:Uncharacterized protein n=1 Tax=Eumeta variegata TaxID=151549 RepID=A0A4C1WUY7_EUMVA|nr:hypothetical protein EVAR_35999_1 [Eumeta japonica]